MAGLLTVRDLAAHLRLTERSIYEKVRRKTIPFIKLDGAIRFDSEHIEAWIKESSIPVTDGAQKSDRGDSL